MRYVGSLLLAWAILSAPAALAAGPHNAGLAAGDMVAVDIAAQPLSAALNSFAAQSGAILIILTPEGMLAGKKAPALAATGSVDELLARLLTGTGVKFERSDTGAIIITSETASLPVTLNRNDPPEDRLRYLERIVVSGSYYESVARAAARERQSESISGSIDAKGIADFPAQNIAEALQRVTGVTVSRDRGEALFVGVRGLPANFQSVTLNGVPLAVNENVRDSSQDGRQFRFDVLPTDMIAGVDVIKAPTAAMDEGAIGAAINIRTFRPLDLPSGTFAFNTSASFPELADAVDPRVSAVSSHKLAGDRLGVLVAASFNGRTLRQDRITFGTWEEINVPGADAPDETVLAPLSFRPTLEREDRDRIGINSVLQFEPYSGLSLEAEAFYVRLDTRYRELTYSADLDPDRLDPDSFIYGAGGALAGLTGVAASQIGYENSELIHDNLSLSGGAILTRDAWEVSGRLSYSEAGSETAAPITRTRLSSRDVGRVTFLVPQLFEGLPDIHFLDADLEAPGLLPFRRIEYRRQASLDTDGAAQIDMRRALNLGPWTDLRAGIKIRQRERDYSRRDRIFSQDAGQFFPASFFVPFPVDNFLSGETGDLPRSWLQPNPDAFAEAVGFTPDFEAPSAADLRNSYRILETIGSAYIMGNFATQAGSADITGNLGLRFSHTRQISEGHAEAGNDPLPVSLTTDYFDTLPSANLHIEFDNGFDVRASAARVIVRPSLADLAPRLTLNSSGTILEAVGGNPALKRYEAWQGDIAGRFHPSENTMLNAGIFYKEFDSFVFSQTTDLVLDGQTYRLTAPTNGGDAQVYGIELSLLHRFASLPAPWNGLGVEANYTRAKSRATYTPTLSDRLENVASESYSVSGIFEHDPLQARIVFNGIGKIPQAVGANDALSADTERFRTIDAILSWRLNDRLELSLEGQNLTDEVQYLSVRDNLLGGYTRYGRTFAISLRYRSGALTNAMKAS